MLTALYLLSFLYLKRLLIVQVTLYRGADKSLVRIGRKQALGHARFQQHRDASCEVFFFFLQGKAPKEIHAILTEILACFPPGCAKDISAPLHSIKRQNNDPQEKEHE